MYTCTGFSERIMKLALFNTYIVYGRNIIRQVMYTRGSLIDSFCFASKRVLSDLIRLDNVVLQPKYLIRLSPLVHNFIPSALYQSYFLGFSFG